MSSPVPAAFISYSREDSDFALRLANDLKASGARVWLDQVDIRPGHSWDTAVEDALMRAEQIVLILSPASARSENVRDEISYALEQGKAIVPVLYMDCVVPLRLQRKQRIDFRADYGSGLQALLAQLPGPGTVAEVTEQTTTRGPIVPSPDSAREDGSAAVPASRPTEEVLRKTSSRSSTLERDQSTFPATSDESAGRRWSRILPAVFITYSLAYLDRTNFGFGIAGIMATLHLSWSRVALLNSIFFLGYFGFQIPGMILARRYSASRIVFFALLGWGALASLTGVLRSFSLLAVDRFLLGVMESIVFPAMLFLLTRWFTRAERSRANTVLLFGNPVTVLWMSAITGYLMQTVGWPLMFIIEGVPSIVWAFIWIRTVRDQPSAVSWLTPQAVSNLETRLDAEQQALPNIYGLRSAFLRPDTILICLQFFCWSLGVYGFVLWLPTIVRQGTHLSMTATGLLSSLPYLAAIILMFLVSFFSDRRVARSTSNRSRREAIVWPFLLISGFALMGSFLLAPTSFPMAFACLVVAGGSMYAPYGPFFALIPERVPRNVSGEVMALVNSFGALGGFAGSYLVGLLQSFTGSPRAGFLLMSLSLAASALLIAALGRPSFSPQGAFATGTHAA